MSSDQWDVLRAADGIPIQVPFVITPGLVVAGLIALLVLLLILTLASWLVWRRIRRSGRLQRGALALRAATLPAGPRREIAALRLELRDNLTQTDRVIMDPAFGATFESLTSLQRRLSHSAATLDRRLRLLADEPDDALLGRLLPGLRERAATISANSSALRRTALQISDKFTTASRSRLEQDLHDEIAGLEAGVREIRALGA